MFATREEALAELRRLASIPWDQAPNLAPCTNWRNCGRHYELAEYDTSTEPSTEIRTDLVLEISAAGAKWSGTDGYE